MMYTDFMEEKMKELLKIFLTMLIPATMVTAFLWLMTVILLSPLSFIQTVGIEVAFIFLLIVAKLADQKG